jgi:hypothetical protein
MNRGYIVAGTYIGFIFTGIIFYMYSLKFEIDEIQKQTLWNWFGAIDTSSAVALAFLAAWGYLEYAKSEQVIKITFNVDGDIYDTGLSLLRKNFTRSELLGVLGMIQKAQKEKFELNVFKDKSILKKLQDIQTGKGKEFIIDMSKEEAEQFFL